MTPERKVVVITEALRGFGAQLSKDGRSLRDQGARIPHSEHGQNRTAGELQ
jgi:hypothetical protein